jgi:hypothetical protein
MKLDVTRMVGELSPAPVQPGEALAPPPAPARPATTLRAMRPLRVALSLCTRTLDRGVLAFPRASLSRPPVARVA